MVLKCSKCLVCLDLGQFGIHALLCCTGVEKACRSLTLLNSKDIGPDDGSGRDLRTQERGGCGVVVGELNARGNRCSGEKCPLGCAGGGTSSLSSEVSEHGVLCDDLLLRRKFERGEGKGLGKGKKVENEWSLKWFRGHVTECGQI